MLPTRWMVGVFLCFSPYHLSQATNEGAWNLLIPFTFKDTMMARTPEGKVKHACTELLKQYNAYYFFPMMGGFGRAGVPDIIVCYRGRFLGIECKAGYNKPTPLQEREIAAIHKAGGSAMVVREDTVDFLEQWLKENGND